MEIMRSLVFFPADHHIGNQTLFEKTINTSIDYAASENKIVTLGIKPDYPATGYGYIQQGEKQSQADELSIYKVNRFTEKPEQQKAEEFIATGQYSWNSGMFIFPVGLVLNELSNYAPEIVKPLQNKGKEAYPELAKISIDYALMEKTTSAYVIPVDFGWDDLGDWNALERLLDKDREGNLAIGNHISQDTQKSIIYNDQKDEIIMTIGLKDVVIVRQGNATLVVHKNNTQDIKKALKLLQKDQSSQKFL